MGAASWRRTLATHAPGEGRVALRTMEALAAAGDRAGALAVADAHGGLLRTEYGAVPDGAVLAFADGLRGGTLAFHDDGETGGGVGAGAGVRTGGNVDARNDAVATAPARLDATPPAGGVTTASFPPSTLPPHGAPEGSGTTGPVSPLMKRRLVAALLVAVALAAAWTLRPRPRLA